MTTTSRRTQDTSVVAAKAGAARDFVAVDDCGDFRTTGPNGPCWRRLSTSRKPRASSTAAAPPTAWPWIRTGI